MASIADLSFLLWIILIVIVLVVLFFFRIIKLPGIKTNVLDPRPYLDSPWMSFTDGRLRIDEIKRYQSVYLLKFEDSDVPRPMRYGIDFFVKTPFPEDGYMEYESPLTSEGVPSMPDEIFSDSVKPGVDPSELFKKFLFKSRKKSIEREAEIEDVKSQSLVITESYDEEHMDGQIKKLAKLKKEKKKKKEKDEDQEDEKSE